MAGRYEAPFSLVTLTREWKGKLSKGFRNSASKVSLVF